MYPARKGLIFQLFTDIWGVYIEDRTGGLDERNGGEKSGEFIAGEESLGKMRCSRHTGVLRMAHDRFANLLRPSLLGEDFVAHERMLGGAGIFFLIEIMQKAGDAVGLAEGLG